MASFASIESFGHQRSTPPSPCRWWSCFTAQGSTERDSKLSPSSTRRPLRLDLLPPTQPAADRFGSTQAADPSCPTSISSARCLIESKPIFESIRRGSSLLASQPAHSCLIALLATYLAASLGSPL